MRLMREVRLFAGQAATEAPPGMGNGWAGTTGTEPVPPFYSVRALFEGPIDPVTGYLCDIKEIDELVRRTAAPRLHRDAAASRLSGPQELVPRLAAAFIAARGRPLGAASLKRLELWISPYTRLAVEQGATLMICLTQSYEFSASHRLHCPPYSDEENRRIFGKCSHPNGHGHNYILDVTIAGAPDAETGLTIPVAELDRVVREQVIEPFDHRNLNVDCAEFKTLNPTVENIASVIHRRLSAALGSDRRLTVRVWETAKTYAELGPE